MISFAQSSFAYFRARSSGFTMPDCKSRTMKVPVPVNGSHNWSRWIQDPSAEQGHRTASIPAMNWDFRLPRTFGD